MCHTREKHSMVSGWKSSQPRSCVWPVVGAEGVGVISSCNAAVIAEHLRKQGYENGSEDLLQPSGEPYDIIRKWNQGIILPKDHSDRRAPGRF